MNSYPLSLKDKLLCHICLNSIDAELYFEHLNNCENNIEHKICRMCNETFSKNNDQNVFITHILVKHSTLDLRKLPNLNNSYLNSSFPINEYEELIVPFDSFNSFNLVQCKLCQNLIDNSIESRKKHIVNFHRGAYFLDKYSLFENSFKSSVKGNYCICKICGVFFENIMIYIHFHAVYFHNTYINLEVNLLQTIFCNICNIETTIQNHKHYSFMTIGKQNMILINELEKSKSKSIQKDEILFNYKTNLDLYNKTSTNNNLEKEIEIPSININEESNKMSLINFNDYMDDYEFIDYLETFEDNKKDKDNKTSKKKFHELKNKSQFINEDLFDYKNMKSFGMNIGKNNKFEKDEIVKEENSLSRMKPNNNFLGGKKIFGNYINPMRIKLKDLILHNNLYSSIQRTYTDKSINKYCQIELEKFKLLFDNILGNHNHSFSEKKPKLTEELRSLINNELDLFNKNFPCNFDAGFFLMVDVNNLQFMKVLIAGERGTPFEHGLYEFDIFIPNDYPKSPPQICCRTSLDNNIYISPLLTNLGDVYYDHPDVNQFLFFSLDKEPSSKYGINYLEGNITLIKCLLKIQNIVLGEKILDKMEERDKKFSFVYEIYENEGYCNIIRYLNLQLAINNVIKNPPKIFKDVVEIYFKIKFKEMIEDIELWLYRANKTGYCFYGDLAKKYNKNLVDKFYEKEDIYKEEIKKLLIEFKNLF